MCVRFALDNIIEQASTQFSIDRMTIYFSPLIHIGYCTIVLFHADPAISNLSDSYVAVLTLLCIRQFILVMNSEWPVEVLTCIACIIIFRINVLHTGIGSFTFPIRRSKSLWFTSITKILITNHFISFIFYEC